MSLRNFKIVHLIILMTVFWFILVSGIIFKFFFIINNVIKETDLILNRNIPIAQLLTDIDSDLFAQLKMLYLNSKDQKKFNEISNSVIMKLNKLQSNLRNLLKYFSEKKIIKDSLILLKKFSYNYKDIKNIYIADTHNDKQLITELLNRLTFLTSKLENDIQTFNSKSKENITHHISKAKRELAIGISFSIAIGVLLSLFIIQNISYKLNNVKVRLQDIATVDADLTKRLNIEGKTEVDEIAQLLNTFIGRIQALISDIKEKGVHLTQQVHELTALAESLASTAVEGQAQAEEVAGTASGTGDQMQNIAAAMEEMTATVSEISQHTSSTSEIASEAVEKMEDAQDMVNKLGDASNSIEAMSTLIGAIAEQTNLLALNATIEAARAGEAGKGFAVVANEVKDLARQTGEAVQDIDSNVRVLQKHVESVVDITSQISEIIRKVNELAGSVAVAVEEQTATTNEISQNTHTATNNVSMLVEMSSAIKDASSQTAAGSEQAKASAKQLKEITLSLRSALDEFTV